MGKNQSSNAKRRQQVLRAGRLEDAVLAAKAERRGTVAGAKIPLAASRRRDDWDVCRVAPSC